MKLFTLPDVKLTGGVDNILSLATGGATVSQPCRWYQITFKSLAAAARIGDSNVTLGTASPYVPGRGAYVSVVTGGQFAPPLTDSGSSPGGNYDLGDVRLIGTAGDIASVCYAI